MKRTLSYVAIAAALALTGACGGGDGEEDETTAGGGAEGIPACAEAGPAIDRPDGIPADFPLPPGTVLTASKDSDSDGVEVEGFIPTTLEGAAKFFTEELPRSGYPLGEGDAEQDEAESEFAGKGLRGKWIVNGILDCPNAVTLRLRVEPG